MGRTRRRESEMTLSAPFNWCDGRCSRCVVAPGCVLRIRIEKLEAEAARRPGDANDWSVTMDQVMDELRTAVDMAERILRKEAPDVDPATLRRPPEYLAATRLRVRGREYAHALFLLCQVLERQVPSPALDQLPAAGALIAGKCGRLAVYLSREGTLEGDAGLRDGVPNALLVERTLAAVDRCLAEHANPEQLPPAYLAARAALLPLVQRILVAIPPTYRRELKALIRKGKAPSPFVQCSVSSARSRDGEGIGSQGRSN